MAELNFCYCFNQWLAPANIFVPSGPAVVTPRLTIFGFTITQTLTETGTEHWWGLVTAKIYDPTSLSIVNQWPLVIPLPHNPYTRVKIRQRRIFTFIWLLLTWPPWGATWSTPTRGAPVTGAAALAASSLPDCSVVGVGCP